MIPVCIPCTCNKHRLQLLVIKLLNMDFLPIVLLNHPDLWDCPIGGAWTFVGTRISCAACWNFLLDKAFKIGDKAIVINDDIDGTKEQFQSLVEKLDDLSLNYSEHDFSAFSITQAAFKEIGFFDAKFWPVYFEDTDYLRRCKLSDAEVWPERVETGLSHNFHANLDEPYRIASHVGSKYCLERYKAKWGGGPGEETLTKPTNQPSTEADVRRAWALATGSVGPDAVKKSDTILQAWSKKEQ